MRVGIALDLLVFLGSVRESTPPRPARLGLRVALACQQHLADKGVAATLVDPLKIDLPRPFKPHFAFAKGKAPADLEALAQQIEAADGYVMVSPEYNHAMSPALADLLNHFGSSLFAYKPSAIVTYSAGQWGGTRAAVNMRTFLAELGCLPVSAMIHVPKAQEALDEDGASRPASMPPVGPPISIEPSPNSAGGPKPPSADARNLPSGRGRSAVIRPSAMRPDGRGARPGS
jgi:chromate reductase, NAD(P)H dehydrogenase (quinone)